MKKRIPKKSEKISFVLTGLKLDLINLYQENFNSLILFGSYARGTANELSDVDILLILNKMNSPYAEITYTSEITIKYLFENEINISLLPTTIERFTKNEITLYATIHNEGILI